MQPHLFCFGLGYTAARLGRRLMAEGWRVSGTTRSDVHADALTKDGFAVHLFDSSRPLADVTGALDGARHILISTPPQDAGDPVLTDQGAALGPLAQDWRWLGYLSTTGVYGDHDGAWVDEATPLTPISDRAQRRVSAERAWQDFAHSTNAPLHIFRLPGIYGPGRNTLEQLRHGKAKRVDKPGQVFSRIHVNDLASALKASMDKPNPGAIYNVCDDEPAAQHEVIAYAASLLGMAPPPLIAFEDIAAQMTPMARSFYAESKRVRNDRIKQELGVRLEFPTYREGLAAIHAHMTA